MAEEGEETGTCREREGGIPSGGEMMAMKEEEMAGKKAVMSTAFR